LFSPVLRTIGTRRAFSNFALPETAQKALLILLLVKPTVAAGVCSGLPDNQSSADCASQSSATNPSDTLMPKVSDLATEASATSNCEDKQESHQAEVERKSGVIILRDANEKAWLANVEYYAPLPGFNRKNRDIDISDLRIARAWHFRQGWEFQLGGLLFRATGNRTAPSPLPDPPQEDSGAFGGAVGPLFRWNFLRFNRWRLFAEAEEDFLITDKDFPAQGSSYNGYFRGGGGASFRLNDSYRLDAAFHFAHVSDAQALQNNPIWNGRGFSLGIRRTSDKEVQPANPERATRSKLPILRDADETAWLTTIDYYAPQPGFNRQNRDIDVENFRVAHVWHFRRGLEFQFGGLVFRASGTRTTDSSPGSIERSDALGGGLGPGGRWNFVQAKPLRLFIEAGPDFIFTNNGFPSGGTNYNFFLRAGGGAAFRVNESYWLETSFKWAQISNGQGSGPGNPTWQGLGVTLSLRHALRVE
jgi:hypothetical protein